MNIEQQVTSLELSKHLKELGVKQESIFKWILSKHPTESCEAPLIQYTIGNEDYKETPIHDGWTLTSYSAFTASELGEMLPASISPQSGSSEEKPIIMQKSHEGTFYIYGQKVNGSTNLIFGENTEADARAKMLIYLLENKLI